MTKATPKPAASRGRRGAAGGGQAGAAARVAPAGAGTREIVVPQEMARELPGLPEVRDRLASHVADAAGRVEAGLGEGEGGDR